MITLIAAIGHNREIGYKNQLLWKIPEDMRHFKNYTMGKMLIMGANTFCSIGNKPLPGRRCIVVTRREMMGVVTAHSIESALSIEHCYDELVVIGGASIYNQTIELADKLVITYVDSEFKADSFFPEIDLGKWVMSNTTELLDSTHKCSTTEYIRIRDIVDISDDK
jgi:dihydrofolate reductase